MLTDHTVAARPLPQNETGRTLVAIPPDATFYSTTQYIAIAWDSEPPAPTGHAPCARAVILGDADHSLPYLADYSLINLLCSDRAMRTIGGQLRVGGRIVSPEDYLGLWRVALALPLTPAELAQKLGLQIVVTLGAALEQARSARCGWTGSPFPTFAEFESTYGHRFTVNTERSGPQRFELELDLREANAARDAFYARSILQDRDEACATTTVSLRPIDNPERTGSQSQLFEGAQP